MRAIVTTSVIIESLLFAAFGCSSAPTTEPSTVNPQTALATRSVESSALPGSPAEGLAIEVPEEPEPAPEVPAGHPLDDWSSNDLESAILGDMATLGSISLGAPNAGRLINGVRMPAGTRWTLMDRHNAWGTLETVEFLTEVVDAVHEIYPETPPLSIGHLSSHRGGPLSPHKSHQSGRDVDLGFYYTPGTGQWYRRATSKNLDRTRTWMLIRQLIIKTDVEMILVDHTVQALLKEHALSSGEDGSWIESVFRGSRGMPPIIRHAPGHATHLHVRFFNPIAQETARRALPLLVKHGVVEPPIRFTAHRARKGETLGRLARRYDTDVRAIQRVNGLRSTRIIAGKTYRIPREVSLRALPRARIPRRRLPPEPSQ